MSPSGAPAWAALITVTLIVSFPRKMGGGEMQGYQVEPWTAVISHHERSAVEQRLEFSCEGPPPPPAPWPGPWADWTGGLRCCDGWLSGAGGGGWGLLRPVCPPADNTGICSLPRVEGLRDTTTAVLLAFLKKQLCCFFHGV